MKISNDTKLASPEGLEPRHVLVVEDDDEMRTFLGEILSVRGYEVAFARDGRSAAHFLATSGEPVDLIVTDVRMPRMSGVELLDRLRDWTIPVVVVSAFVDDEACAEVEALGAAAILSKPFSLRDFGHAIDHATRA